MGKLFSKRLARRTAIAGVFGAGFLSVASVARADDQQVDLKYFERYNSKTLVPYALLSFDGFVAKYQGRFVDLDGFPASNPYQCWDLWEAYSREVVGKGGISTAYGPHPGYAIGIWDGYFRNGANTHYDRVSASSSARTGDVAFWQWGSSPAPVSHVAIVIADQGSSLLTFGQNAPAGAPASKFMMSKSGVAGYLRPKRTIGDRKLTPEQDKMLREVHSWLANGISGVRSQGDLRAKIDRTDAQLTELKLWMSSGISGQRSEGFLHKWIRETWEKR